MCIRFVLGSSNLVRHVVHSRLAPELVALLVFVLVCSMLYSLYLAKDMCLSGGYEV